MQNCIFWYVALELRIKKGCNKNLFQFTFEIKYVFGLFIFKLDFVLKIKNNLFALS